MIRSNQEPAAKERMHWIDLILIGAALLAVIYALWLWKA
jgi:hypothetical protein